MRKGRIQISNELYVNEYDVVKAIFKWVRPTHIEFEQWNGVKWIIWGESDKFDDVVEGSEIPLYDVEIATSDGIDRIYTFVKI
jgi:hypothetical protein